MTALLFFFGPLLAMILPLLLLIVSAVQGARAKGRVEDSHARVLVLLLCSALVVPSTIPWPAPWWFAALEGDFEYQWIFFLLIGGTSLFTYYFAMLLGRLTRRGRDKFFSKS